MTKFLYLFICIPLLTTAQSKTYTATKKGPIEQLVSKTDTIGFSEYMESKHGTSQRFVSINGSQYKFVKWQLKGKYIEEIFDSSGHKLVTIPLSGTDKNSIMFPDGTQLKFQSVGKTSWSYTKNGKDAVKGFYYVWNDQKHYVVQLDDTTLTSPVVPAIVLEYSLAGKHVYHNKKRTTGIIAAVGISSMLAIMRLAMDDDDGY